MTDKDIKIEIQAESGKASAEIKKLTKQIDTMNKRIKNGGRATVGEVGQMTRSFKSLTAHVSKLALIYGSFKALMTSTVITAKFEQSIQKLGVISGATAIELGQLEDEAKNLGESTIFSASQVSEGMNQMAQSGLDTAQILAGTGDILNLASVSMITLAEASDLAVVSMNTYGLEATDINDITDILAKGATIGATTVTELGQALVKVGSVASSAGQSLEETVAMLDVLADGGMRSALAGTQLKISLLRLSSNKEAKKFIKELAVASGDLALNMFTAEGALKPVRTQLGDVWSALQKVNEESRKEYLAGIFGTEAVASMEILLPKLGEVDEKLRTIREAMANNFALKSAEAIVDTLVGSFQNLRSALEGLAIKIVSEMTPALREMLDSWTETIRGMDEDEIKDFADALTGLVDGITSVTGAMADIAGATIGFISENRNLVGALALTVGGLKVLRTQMVATFVTGLLTATGSVASFVIAIGILETRLKMLWATMALNPLGLVLLAIGGASIAVGAYLDSLQNSNAEAEKQAKLYLKQADAITEYTDKLEDSVDRETGAIGKNNVERAKLAIEINNHIIALQKADEALDKNALGEKEWARRKKENAVQLSLFDEALIAIGKSWTKETEAKKKSEVQEIANLTISKKAIENFEKYDKALNKKIKSSESAVKKIVKAERGLVLEQAKLEAERIAIINKYADKRLQILEEYDKLEYEGSTSNLDGLKKYNAEKLRIEELLAKGRSALNRGATEEASRYYAEAKSMASSFAGSVIEENGAILVSAKQTYSDASGYYKETKQAELAILEKQRVEELKVHKQKLDLNILELKGQRALLKMQGEFLKKLGELGDKAKETKRKFDEPEYLEKINKEFDEFITKMESDSSELGLDIDNREAKFKLDEVKRKKDSLTTTEPIKLSVDDGDVKNAGEAVDTLGSKLLLYMGEDGKYYSEILVDDGEVDEATEKMTKLKDGDNYISIGVQTDQTAFDSLSDEVAELIGVEKRVHIELDAPTEKLDIAQSKLQSLTIGDYKVKVGADTTPLDFGIDAKIAEWQTVKDQKDKQLVMVTNPEFTKTEKLIKDFLRKQKNTPIEKDVTIDSKSLNAEADVAKTEIENKPPAEMQVTADTNPAVVEAQRVTGIINSLNPILKIGVDASRPLAMIAKLKLPTQSIHTIIERRIPARASGGYIEKLATGGHFTGDGIVGGYDPTDSDSVTAKLTGGEYVVNRTATDHIGIGVLDAINGMKFDRPKGYADGGLVDGSSSVVSRNINLNFMDDNGSGMSTMTDEQTAQRIENYFRKYAQ